MGFHSRASRPRSPWQNAYVSVEGVAKGIVIRSTDDSLGGTFPPLMIHTFGRPIGNAGAGVERLKRAIEEKNRALLINTLREVRSLERLLFLRSG